MIPDTFDRVELSIHFDYENILVEQGSTKSLLKSKDGKWMERDMVLEREILDTLSPVFSRCDVDDSSGTHIKEAGEGIDEFFDTIEQVALSEHIRFEYLQDTRRLTSRSLSVKVKVESGIDWFDTTVTTLLGDEPLPDADKIFKAMRNKQRFVRLDNGTTILLKDTLKQSIDDLDDAGIDLGKNGILQKIPKHMIGALRSSGKGNVLSFDLDSSAKKLKKSFENFA